MALMLLLRDNQATLQFGNRQIRAEVASTEAAREKGLSGRAELGQDQGMLFVFDEVGKYCFWMKNTNFPLDILWLDSDKKVVDIELNISPDTYPASFCPEKAAKYALEVNSGLSQQEGVGLGSQL